MGAQPVPKPASRARTIAWAPTTTPAHRKPYRGRMRERSRRDMKLPWRAGECPAPPTEASRPEWTSTHGQGDGEASVRREGEARSVSLVQGAKSAPKRVLTCKRTP